MIKEFLNLKKILKQLAVIFFVTLIMIVGVSNYLKYTTIEKNKEVTNKIVLNSDCNNFIENSKDVYNRCSYVNKEILSNSDYQNKIKQVKNLANKSHSLILSKSDALAFSSEYRELSTLQNEIISDKYDLVKQYQTEYNNNNNIKKSKEQIEKDIFNKKIKKQYISNITSAQNFAIEYIEKAMSKYSLDGIFLVNLMYGVLSLFLFKLSIFLVSVIRNQKSTAFVRNNDTCFKFTIVFILIKVFF